MFAPDMRTYPKVNEAIDFALEKHFGHTYNGTSYVYGHLIPVARIAYGINATETVAVAAILHDVIEDAGVTVEELTTRFGQRVAHIVWCVSDEPGKNRKARKMNSYWKIRSDEIATLVKLSDRFHNVSGEEKREMYRKEHYLFRCALWHPDTVLESLWNDIEMILFPDEKTRERYM
jgi:(p)ppGpp synthase/HD superfamily hydrolase